MMQVGYLSTNTGLQVYMLTTQLQSLQNLDGEAGHVLRVCTVFCVLNGKGNTIIKQVLETAIII